MKKNKVLQNDQDNQQEKEKSDFKTTFLNVDYLRFINKYKVIIDNLKRKIKNLETKIILLQEENNVDNLAEIENIKKRIEELQKKLNNVEIEGKKYFEKIKSLEEIFKNNYFLELKNVRKNFGKKEVLKGINLKIKKGDRISIIGHNG